MGQAEEASTALSEAFPARGLCRRIPDPKCPITTGLVEHRPAGMPGPRPSRLVEPDALETVEQRGRVLLEALHRGLGEVDGVRREEPEVRHVLQDHDLDAVVDLLALLEV